PASIFVALTITLGALPSVAGAQAQVRSSLRDSVAAVGGRVIVTYRPAGGGAAARIKGQPAVSAMEGQAITGRLASEGKLRSPRRLDLLGGASGQVNTTELAALLAD